MEIITCDHTMELTSDQVWNILKVELIDGLDSGELSEDEFADQMKTLRNVVNTNEFKLVIASKNQVATAGDASVRKL